MLNVVFDHAHDGVVAAFKELSTEVFQSQAAKERHKGVQVQMQISDGKYMPMSGTGPGSKLQIVVHRIDPHRML